VPVLLRQGIIVQYSGIEFDVAFFRVIPGGFLAIYSGIIKVEMLELCFRHTRGAIVWFHTPVAFRTESFPDGFITG
jgi:hypothetical protein